MSEQEQRDNNRCAVCGWPLKEKLEDGCIRGNCSMRPFPDYVYDPERANLEYNTDRFKHRPLTALESQLSSLRVG